MGHYLLGFVIGAAVGAVVVAFSSGRNGPALRASLGDALDEALTVGQAAQAERERALWAEFRATNGTKPSILLTQHSNATPKIY